MKRYCVKCTKALGFEKHKSSQMSGYLCWDCKKQEMNEKPTYPLTGIRIGLAVVSVIAFIGLMWGLLSFLF